MNSKSDINVGYNLDVIIFCYFLHKMNLVIVATKVKDTKYLMSLVFFMIAHIFKNKLKVVGDLNSQNLLVDL